MSTSYSLSQQQTTTSTDSYNRTYHKVFNLSDVGNLSDSGNITIAVGSDDNQAQLLPYILGALGIFGLLIFFK